GLDPVGGKVLGPSLGVPVAPAGVRPARAAGAPPEGGAGPGRRGLDVGENKHPAGAERVGPATEPLRVGRGDLPPLPSVAVVALGQAPQVVAGADLVPDDGGLVVSGRLPTGCPVLGARPAGRRGRGPLGGRGV